MFTDCAADSRGKRNKRVLVSYLYNRPFDSSPQVNIFRGVSIGIRAVFHIRRGQLHLCCKHIAAGIASKLFFAVIKDALQTRQSFSFEADLRAGIGFIFLR